MQQLNEKFIKARRDYESLLESSMAQSAQAYSRPYAPPGAGYGAPPPQNYGPQRFYTTDGQPPNAAVPNYPPAGPPQGGQFQPPYPVSSPPPQPHTALAAGQPPSQPLPQDGQYQYPSTGPVPQRQQSQHSTFSPQEMGTSVYDTPVDGQNRTSYHFQQQSQPPYSQPTIQTSQHLDSGPNETYSPSVYSHHDANQSSSQLPSQPPPSQNTSYPSQPPTQPGYPPPQQPGYAPPAPPDSSQPPQLGGYSNYQSLATAPPTQYQAYQPSASPAPAGYYR